jgi:hypothetical protein
VTEKNEAARAIRIGAERLREVATREPDPDFVADLIRVAQEMDEHAAEIERSIANEQPLIANDAAA